MGWRFQKSFSPFKGVRINLGKRGIGLSGGVKGFRIGIGPKGPYTSTSIPGTGLYRVDHWGGKRASNAGGCAVVAILAIGAIMGYIALFGRPTEPMQQPAQSSANVPTQTLPAEREESGLVALPAARPPSTLQPGQLYQLSGSVIFYQERPDASGGVADKAHFTLPAESYFLCAGIERDASKAIWYRARVWDNQRNEYHGWLDGREVTPENVAVTAWRPDQAEANTR